MSLLELDTRQQWGIRLDFREMKSFDTNSAQQIEHWRGNDEFTSLDDLARRTQLTANDLQLLA